MLIAIILSRFYFYLHRYVQTPNPGPGGSTKCQHNMEKFVFYFWSFLLKFNSQRFFYENKSKFQKCKNFLSSLCILFMAYIQWCFVLNLFNFPLSNRNTQSSLIFYRKTRKISIFIHIPKDFKKLIVNF